MISLLLYTRSYSRVSNRIVVLRDALGEREPAQDAANDQEAGEEEGSDEPGIIMPQNFDKPYMQSKIYSYIRSYFYSL